MPDAGQTPASMLHRTNAPMVRPIADRRRFFKQFMGETLALIDEVRGKPQCKLTELWGLSDQDLAAITPRVCPGVEILSSDCRVCARLPEKAELLTLFACTEENVSIFNGFNGVNSIGRIAGELNVRTGFDLEESYARVRRLFLQAMRLQVCIPSNESSAQAVPLPG